MAFRLARAGLTFCLLALFLPCALAEDRLLEQPARLRIVWGGQEARRWTGRISIVDGSLSDLQLLGIDADEAGSIWIEDGAIRVAAIRPHRFDGLDVTVTAGEGARLAIELSTDGMVVPETFELEVGEALRKRFRQPLIGQTSELLIDRAPNDALRIETASDTLIFAPGETYSFSARPVLDDLKPATTIDVNTTLSRARSGTVVWSDSQRTTVPANGQPITPVNVPLPNEEGVYEVRVSVSHPPGNLKAFFPVGGKKPIVERKFQIVVWRSVVDTTVGSNDWQSVLDIDPANPRWWQRLPNWTQLQRLPGFAPRPLGSLRAATVNHPLGLFVELPATQANNEPHWQAYALPIERVGVPHVLELEYPADREQHLGVSILEPNVAGRIVPIGRDSGVFVEGLGRAEQTTRHRHRVVFWPRTNSPMLLVTNLHPSAVAQFGRIRVLRGAERLVSATEPQPWQESQRLVAAYFGRPLVPEFFGATEGLDAVSGQNVDDLETFYEASERTIQYLRWAGYNAAVVNVLADGSSVYPSDLLQPTPLYDTGRIVAGAADLPKSDGLEMMLRSFDRAGLALVPSLQLAGPLPELEPLRRMSDPRTSGLEWVDGDGRSWLEVNGAERGLAPYYNLLDKRVQEAVLNVVREIVSHYGHHPALAGIAVQLSSSGYAQLPGIEWGFDDATIADFERETGVHLAASGLNRFAERQAALLGEHIDTWRAWRAERVTRFYSRLAEQLQSPGSPRRLLLTTEEMFSAPRLQAQLQPNLRRPDVGVDQRMLDLGMDRQQLAVTPGIMVCPARFVAPVAPLVDRATDLVINDALAGISSTGAEMIFHRPQRQRLSSFDEMAGLGSYTLLVAQSSADAAAARKPLAEMLATRDPTLIINGGELLPMGQEDATSGIFRMLQQLPSHAKVSMERQQPIVVRSYAEASGTTQLVVNECPWSVDADITLDLPVNAELEMLAGSERDAADGESTTQSLAAGLQHWKLHLKPYGIVASRVSAPGARVTEIRASISEAAKAELQAQLADLTGRNLTATSKYEQLANPRFEPSGDVELPGWHLVKEVAGATAKLDEMSPAGGKTCLALQSQGPAVAVESNTFATPETGQLLMAVWVRGENLAPASELRIVFEADRPGRPYRTYWTLGGNQPRAQPIGGKWKFPFAVGVNDLPLDSKGKMRVRFELTGPGNVWIDEAQLYDVLFPLSFYRYTKEEKLELVKLRFKTSREYEENQLADCVQSLESYWPRFLVEYLPLVEPATESPMAPVVQQPAANQQPNAASNQDKKSEEISGWRKWMPSFLR